MKFFYLERRDTGNPKVKYTHIEKKIMGEKTAYAFYSTSDECNYVYGDHSLLEAVLSYEKDTKHQGFAEIQYITKSETIAKEFEEMPPF